MSKRPESFKFRLSGDERRAIAALAALLRRSQSDAVRFVITEVARQLTQGHLDPAPTLPIPVDNQKHEDANGAI